MSNNVDSYKVEKSLLRIQKNDGGMNNSPIQFFKLKKKYGEMGGKNITLEYLQNSPKYSIMSHKRIKFADNHFKNVGNGEGGNENESREQNQHKKPNSVEPKKIIKVNAPPPPRSLEKQRRRGPPKVSSPRPPNDISRHRDRRKKSKNQTQQPNKKQNESISRMFEEKKKKNQMKEAESRQPPPPQVRQPPQSKQPVEQKKKKKLKIPQIPELFRKFTKNKDLPRRDSQPSPSVTRERKTSKPRTRPQSSRVQNRTSVSPRVVQEKNDQIKNLKRKLSEQKRHFQNELQQSDTNYARTVQKNMELEQEISRLRENFKNQSTKKYTDRIAKLEKTQLKKDKLMHYNKELTSRLERKLEKTKQYYRQILLKLGRNRLSHFRIDPSQITLTGTQLGEGSFGIVLEGNWNVNRRVAVKEVQLNPGSKQSDKKEVIREFEAQVQLLHPNVLQVFGYSEPKENVIQIIMERMDMNLFEFLQKKRPRLSQKIDFMKMMSRSLFYLHHQKPVPLIHRDVKSQNFLVSEDGKELKMCDFGFIRTMTLSKTFVQSSFQGTVLWMAPETIEVNPKYSIYSDVYALGIAFWEVLFERVPFSDLLRKCQGNPQIYILKQIEEGARPDITHPLLPIEFKTLLEKMWMTDPHERPTTDYLREFFREAEVKKLKKKYGTHFRFPCKSRTKKKKKKKNKENNNNNNNNIVEEEEEVEEEEGKN